MRLYRTTSGCILEEKGYLYSLNGVNTQVATWDSLITRDDLHDYLRQAIPGEEVGPAVLASLRAPIGNQEVWAAGVTYYRSREARIHESKATGTGDFYERVYHADRPELFFKATPHRVVGPGDKVAIRDDASWSVPEPELALAVTPKGKIVGYTVGNDMSSRDLEGENPLYLPQAKVYDRSCALGPCLLVTHEPLPPSTEIRLEIVRGGGVEFAGATTLSAMKRDPRNLVEYLFRNNTFPQGCFLLTGTGIVPPDSFALQVGDEVRITITGIGTLTNVVG